MNNNTKKKTLKQHFPIEVEGIGTFETIKQFMIYCNVSRSVMQKARADHPDNWVDILIEKDTGPYYVNGVEYANKAEVAKKIGMTTKALGERVNQHGYANIQEYLDYLEDTMVYYNGIPIYSPSSLSELTEMNIKTCAGVLSQVRALGDEEERTERLKQLVQQRREVITVIKKVDPEVKNITEFVNKHNVSKHIVSKLEGMDKSLDFKIDYLRYLTEESREVMNI